MVDYLRIPLAAGGDVLVEVAENEAGMRRATRVGDAIAAVAESLEERLRPIQQAAAAALEVFRGIGPEKVEIEFGVKLNVEAGAIIARTEAEGHLKVKLVWQPEARTS